MSDQRPPSVSRVLEQPQAKALVFQYGHALVAAAIRQVTEASRSSLDGAGPAVLAERAGEVLLRGARSALRPLWNMTGTVLHTNLGRAVLSEGAIAAASAAMSRHVALEYDLAAGGRGERDSALNSLLNDLTGAEGSLLVNNNAAAVMLVLAGLAHGREVIVSRGELIEIGGAFRLPAIMEAAGVRLREVGTTNRTHLKDYAEAIGPETALILKVHPSNFRIEGFTKDVPAAQLAGLARQHGVLLVNDLGSGTLHDLAPLGLPGEPTVAEAVAEGSDLVTFSGDKLLGGPQAGFVIGRQVLIDRLKTHPMKRAMRLDKVRLAALEVTLREYQQGRENPTWAALRRPLADIAEAARRLVPQVAALLPSGYGVTLRDNAAQVGSGAAPTAALPSVALAITGRSLETLAAAFRELDEPVIGRIGDGALLLDLRCLLPEQERAFLAALSGLSATA